MTSTTLASLQQVDDESLKKLIDRFGCTVIQIWNIILEIVLHSMLLALRPDKSTDSPCKKPKGYIQMEEMSRFINKVR